MGGNGWFTFKSWYVLTYFFQIAAFLYAQSSEMAKFLLFLAISVLCCFPLHAQLIATADTVRVLQEVTITYQPDRLTPVTFQNLSEEYLEIRSTGQEPSFLLAKTPSITAYSDAGNTQGYSYFRLRGIDQTRINITLDGMPLNEPEDQGAYFSNFPDILNSVSNLQIQRGVGTSKNGVASYGGSLELSSPNLFGEEELTFGLGYGSFNSLRAFGEYQSGEKNNKAIYVRASQIYSDGYKYNSSNNSRSVFFSGGLKGDQTVWKLNVLAGRQKNELAWLGVSDSLIRIDPRTDANENENDEFTQAVVQLQNQWAWNQSSSLQSSAYYNYLQGNYDFNLNNFLELPTDNELFNYAFQSHWVGFFTNYRFSKNNLELRAGVHANTYERKHTGSEYSLGELYQNTGFKNELSLFSKADYTWRKTTFFADLQYRLTEFKYQGVVALPNLNWNFFNPKVGISFAVNDNTVAYYSLGRTGREPTRNDLFGGNDDLLQDEQGNALTFIRDPEYVTDQELGIRYFSDKIGLGANLFYMDFENEIVLSGQFGPNGLALTNNVEQSYRTGLEVFLNYQISKRWSIINNSSYNHSRIKEENETFQAILTPQFIFNQEVIYTKEAFSLALSARYQSESYLDFANTELLDGYLLINARAQYNHKKWQLGLFLNNVTNVQYFNNGYVEPDGTPKYFVQVPFNVYSSVMYRF